MSASGRRRLYSRRAGPGSRWNPAALELAEKLFFSEKALRLTRELGKHEAFAGHRLGSGSELAFGMAGAVGPAGVLRAQLFGVAPADPVVIAGMTAASALRGLLAIAFPARAAASLDPASALKD